MKSALAMCFAALLAAAGSGHAAQGGAANDPGAGYPARPIRLIVPFPPGGSNDILARYFAQYLTERLGRQVIVDNRARADAIIGTEIASRSQPDGFMRLMQKEYLRYRALIRRERITPL